MWSLQKQLWAIKIKAKQNSITKDLVTIAYPKQQNVKWREVIQPQQIIKLDWELIMEIILYNKIWILA